jgi:hypothetical protein
VPKPDITAYEVALILDAILPPNARVKLGENRLLKTIIKKWPLPDICRHIQPINEGIEDDFETAIRKAARSLFQEQGRYLKETDKWWLESVNRSVITEWAKDAA